MSGSSPSWSLHTSSLPGGNAFYQVAVGKKMAGYGLWRSYQRYNRKTHYVNRLDGLGFADLNSSIISSISIADDYLFAVNDTNATYLQVLVLYWYSGNYIFTGPHGCFTPTATAGIVGTPNSDGNRSNVAGNDDGQVFILNTSGHIYQDGLGYCN